MSLFLYYLREKFRTSTPSTNTGRPIVIAVLINMGLNIINSITPIPFYHKLLDQEQIWATDLGIGIRELIDQDTQHFVPLPKPNVLIGLDATQTQQYLQTLIQTESSFQQKTINNAGYMGLGQFGASALVQAGLVDRAKFRAARKAGILQGQDGWIGQKDWLADANNWLLKGGRKAFLNSYDLQIAAIVRLANINLQAGYRHGALHKNDSATKHAGYAKAAHLVGSYGATLWYKYRIDSTDGNTPPMSASTYAQQGEAALK